MYPLPETHVSRCVSATLSCVSATFQSADSWHFVLRYILTKKVDVKITSGNIISDISDHYSQFCVFHTSIENSKSRGKRFRDSGFSEDTFNLELYNLLSNEISHGDDSFDVDKAFSHFYDSSNVLVNKHAPLKTVSNRMRKQSSKPWITSGLKKTQSRLQISFFNPVTL